MTGTIPLPGPESGRGLLPISAKTGEGLDALCGWILKEVDAVKAGKR